MTVTYRTILVPLDGSALSERALPVAVQLAEATKAHLVLVEAAQAIGLGGPQFDAQQQALTEKALTYLQEKADSITELGIDVSISAPMESAAEAIVLELDLQNADLIVMSTHGRSGPGRWIFGSVTEAVLARSPVPVVVVSAQGALPTSVVPPVQPRLVVPLDGSAFAEAALPYASALAQAMKAMLILIRLVPPQPAFTPERLVQPGLLAEMIALEEEEARGYLKDVAARLRADGLAVETRVRSNAPAAAIIQESDVEDASLIVMTTHGRTGLQQALYGSVALNVLRHGQRPVCLIRPSMLQGA